MADIASLFQKYKCDELRNVSREEFRKKIEESIGIVDAASEGYRDYEIEAQRDLSLKFHWGHNHNFGDFMVEGRMGNRHLHLMERFTSLFPFTMEDIDGKSVLDVGCWTGGTTLLLAAAGAHVTAIEEVRKYADMANYLFYAFGLTDSTCARACSLYDLNTEEWRDQFDIVYFPGVIYHVTDPVLALRIIFNSLRVDGTIMVESMGINSNQSICSFEGCEITHSGTEEDLNRGGWNWFVPSPSALARMLSCAGFDEVESVWDDESHRVYAFAKKRAVRGICRAGLSMRDIP